MSRYQLGRHRTDRGTADRLVKDLGTVELQSQPVSVTGEPTGGVFACGGVHLDSEVRVEGEVPRPVRRLVSCWVRGQDRPSGHEVPLRAAAPSAPGLSRSAVRTRSVPLSFHIARGELVPVVWGTSTVMSVKVYSITASFPVRKLQSSWPNSRMSVEPPVVSVLFMSISL